MTAASSDVVDDVRRAADSHRHLRVSAGPRGALRRRPQTGRIPDRDIRPLRRVGAGLSGSRVRSRQAARVYAARARRARRAAADRQERRRRHASDGAILSIPRAGAGRRGSLGFRPQKGFAKLRTGAGEGLRPSRTPARGGRGLFAAALVDAFPHLPVEEEGRLADPRLRDNFVERVFAYRRMRGLFDVRWAVGDVVRFHTAHKLLLLAHAPEAYRQLGRLVAGARGMSRRDLKRRYIEGFMGGLAQLATSRRHTNVLQHMAGYFKDRLDAASKRELAETIADYRRGLVPVVVPLTLLRHYVRMFDVAYLAGQTYLQPHPKELMLRNHV